MRRLAYFIGEPGVGKSTLVRSLLAPYLEDFGRDGAPFEVWAGTVGSTPAAYLGNPHHPLYPGTDRLSMSVAPRVLAWLAECPYELVIGEGDRLATPSFLHSASHALGYDVWLLACTSVHAEARRRARAAGADLPPQSGPWVQGRRTKVANLVAGLSHDPAFHVRELVLDGAAVHIADQLWPDLLRS